MMDAVTVLVLLGLVFYAVKKKLLPRLIKNRQERSQEKDGGTSMTDCKLPDFCILSFNTGDFTHTDDLAHCVEYELGKAIGDLKKEGCQLISDPFPVVIGCSLLIFLYYYKDTVIINTEEVAG